MVKFCPREATPLRGLREIHSVGAAWKCAPYFKVDSHE